MQFFYDLGASLRQLESLRADMTLADAWPSLWGTKQILDSMFEATWFFPAIKSAFQPGQNLLMALNKLTQRNDFSEELGFLDLQSVERPRGELETILRAELATADAYYVSRKGAYDSSALISNAEALFSQEIHIKVPAAIPEIREAGKCLAFELTTASGFHLFRATEIVLRSYWDFVSNDAVQPSMKSIGGFIKQMEDKKCGSDKVIAALRQINSLHRNPLIHPEESLSLDEAVGLIGICVSAVNQMLREMPAPLPPQLPPLGEVIK